MKIWSAITLFTLAFLPAAAHATEYVVSAENGNDSNPGTANPYSPWKTLQKAADIAGAGDRVRVESGTYSGRVVIKKSGAVFEGVPGDVNSLETIIDGSDAVTRWDPEGSFGNGRVWRATLPYKAYAMTTSDDRTIWRIHDNNFRRVNPEWADGREIMGRPPDYIYHNSSYMGDNPIQYWDAIGGYFATDENNDKVVYLRLRNGQSPATRGVRSSPQAAVFTLNGVNNVTLRNFKIRGAYYGVHLTGGASDNVIENCYVINGKTRFYINNASRNIIRNNDITMNGECCATYLPGDWGGFNYARAAMFVIYIENKYIVGRSSEDDSGVFMWDGADNQIVGNHIYNSVVGIKLEGGRGVKILGNTINNTSAEGIYSTEEESAEIAHNLIYDNDHNIRIAMENEKTVHIYANRFFQPKLTEESGGKHIHLAFTRCDVDCNSPSDIYIYHNSFAGGGYAVNGGGRMVMEGLRVANNLFSTLDLRDSWPPETVGTPFDEHLNIKPLWFNNTIPDFIPPASARNSAPHDVSGWPGMTSAYYQDGDPDYGAIQGNGTPAAFDFSLTHGGNRSVVQGLSTANTISAGLLSGTGQSVAFVVSGLPAGAAGNLSSGSCTPSCSTTLTIQTSNSTPLGVYPVTVTGAGGGKTHGTTFNLTVRAPAGPVETITLEAESGTLTAPMALGNDGSASAGRYVWTPEGAGNDFDPAGAGGKAVYAFSAAEAGDYFVWVRMMEAGGNSFYVDMDGAPREAWHLPTDAAWVWAQRKEGDNPLAYSLSAGSHQLTIHQREDGTKLDLVVITNDPDFVPTLPVGDSQPPSRPLGFRFR